MGFSGQPFTWHHGSLYQQLDRVLANDPWQFFFFNSKVSHMNIPSSDHCGLWLLVSDGVNRHYSGYFKFLVAWLQHPEFPSLVHNGWHLNKHWNENMKRVTDRLNFLEQGLFWQHIQN